MKKENFSPPLNTADFHADLIETFRQWQLAHYHTLAAKGEIPAAQASILTDMSVNRLKELLHSADETKQEIAYRIVKTYGK